MRDIELEEGEAYFPLNDDDDENIDLDKDFSYIDRKLECFLGHYQKYFMNGYSANRAGPIFGDYGSFLPMQERYPTILSNQKTQNHISSKCPPDLPSENPTLAANISLQSRTVPVLSNQPASEIFTVDNQLKVKNSAKCASHHDHQPKKPLFPLSEKNTLKFRVKVASKSDLSRDNTATIYSDLGLDMSPSTSTEDTPLDNEDLPGLQKMNLESPSIIVKIMTSIPLPNEALVSPLHADLISLTESKNTLETNLPALNIVNDSGYLHGKEAMDDKKTKPMDTTNEKKAKQRKASLEMNPKQNIKMKTSESKASVVLDKKNEIKSLVAKSDNFVKQGQVVEGGNVIKITMKTEKEKTVVELPKDDRGTEKRKEFLHREAEEKKPLKQCSVVKQEDFNQVCPRKAIGCMKESGNHKKIAKDIEVKHDEPVTSKQKSNVKAMPYQQLGPSFEDSSASIVKKKLKGFQTGNVTSTELPRGSVISSSGVEYGEVICNNIPSRSKTYGIDLPREICKGKVNVIENCSQKEKEVTSRDAQQSGRKMKGQVTSKKTAFANSDPNLGVAAGVDCLKGRDPVGELPPQENASLVPLEMDDWVQCEKCQKWRLLPFGTNPDSLPKEWICRMLTWLPEMNKCTFTEDETSQALRALYISSASGPALLAQNDQQAHLDGVAGVKAENVAFSDSATKPDVMVGRGKVQSSTTLEIHTARQSGAQDLHKPIKKDPRHFGGIRSLKNLKNDLQETVLAGKFATGTNVPSKVPKKRTAEVQASGGSKKSKKVHQQSFASSGPGRLLPLEVKGGSQNYGPDASQISREFVHRSPVCPPLKVKIRGRSEMAGINDEVNGVNDVSEKTTKLKSQVSRKIDDAIKTSEKARDFSLSDNATISSSSKVTTKVKLKARVVKSSPVRSISSSPLKVCKPDPDQRTNSIAASYNEPKEMSSRKRLKSRAEGAFASNEFAPRNEEIKHRKSNLARTPHDDQSSKEGSAGRPSNVNRVDAQSNVEGRDGKLDHRHYGKETIASKQNPESQMPNESQFDGTSLDRHKFLVTEMGAENKSFLYSNCIPGFEKDNGSNSLRIDHGNGKLSRHGLDDHVNLRHQGHTMHNSKDVEASSSKKKDSLQWAVTALKEARDLKHSANRLKTAGSGISTRLFFQAALKFLHGASLLEPQNSEHGRNGEMSPTDVYSSTAKLCEYCAHEYEKCNDMASAALAYKCMEVAYMRVVYNSDVTASRDRVELQMAVRDTPQVDSPSSSASDVDNLNSQVAIDLARGGLSVMGHRSHVIAAENRPNFVRLLNFTRDINFAMEASRRSQVAFAVANPILSQAGNEEGISYIKRVIDFSFHDLDGLLHLTRLAMESLNN